VKRDLPEGTLVIDGATGSELDRRGVDCSEPLWSANANLVASKVLKEVHRHYLLNGAKAITTNTFRTTERTLNKVDLGHLAKSLT
jgi:homocysteine S-methyltransferase